MKATELIAKLQALVAEFGDAAVVPLVDEADCQENRALYAVLRLDDGSYGLYASLPNIEEEE